MTAMAITSQGPEAEALEAIKRQTRRTWSAGDYDAVVDGIWAAGEAAVRAARVGRGDAVIDIACGTGNAAIQAAQAGGSVTGIDLTPELLAAGRNRAAQAGVEVDFVEGDAESLPFDDASFDVVLSTFGVMFAARHEVAAREIVRVLRPGGRIGLANWHPDGTVGEMFRTMARHLPPPPPLAEPPLLWGNEAHVRELFGDDIDLDVTTSLLWLLTDRDPGASADLFLEVFPPLVTARALLEPQDAWEQARTEVREVLKKMYEVPAAYLLVSGSKPMR